MPNSSIIDDKIYIPLQMVLPSPLNPLWQVQWNEPSVLWQSARWWQLLDAALEHSSTSAEESYWHRFFFPSQVWISRFKLRLNYHRKCLTLDFEAPSNPSSHSPGNYNNAKCKWNALNRIKQYDLFFFCYNWNRKSLNHSFQLFLVFIFPGCCFLICLIMENKPVIPLPLWRQLLL